MNSTQILSYVPIGEVAEWTKAADCKSAGASLRRFESCPPQKEDFSALAKHLNTRPLRYLYNSIIWNTYAFLAGVAQLARASAFQAEGRGFESRLPLGLLAHVAQPVEHILGKDEVSGSSPLVGSILMKIKNCVFLKNSEYVKTQEAK